MHSCTHTHTNRHVHMQKGESTVCVRAAFNRIPPDSDSHRRGFENNRAPLLFAERSQRLYGP